MELNLTDFVVMAVLVGVGCALGYLGLWFMLRQAVHEQHEFTEDRLSKLSGVLKALEARLAGLGEPPALPAATAPVVEVKAAADEGKAVHLGKEEVTQEVLVVIAAAVTAFLGKKVRVRSAKMLQSSCEVVNPWSQQGRMLIHASHNLRLRG